MHYSIEQINEVIGGHFLNEKRVASTLSHIVYDTRKISYKYKSVFFALASATSDGHLFISDGYKKGLRNFIVSQSVETALFPEANFIQVTDTKKALQDLATHYRATLNYPIIAITGSNGKTIVKEWLAQALSARLKIGKSPMSYNSQIGVPLSLLQLESDNDFGIIEAGISEKNEMENLAAIIKPKIGLFTNLGDAHNAGFGSKLEKLVEKLKLFQSCELLIYNCDDPFIQKQIELQFNGKVLSWGKTEKALIKLNKEKIEGETARIELLYKGQSYSFEFHLFNKQYLENALHIISYLIYLDWSQDRIQESIQNFSTLPNRLEIKAGHRNSTLINDSYSSDLSSFQIAFETLEAHSQAKTRIAIISELEHQSNLAAAYKQLVELINDKKIDQVYAIGIPKSELKLNASTRLYQFESTTELLTQLNLSQFKDSVVLIKGASKYKLDRVVHHLALKLNQTRLEINFSSIKHNLQTFKSQLKPRTKLMIVVKAEAYGSGSLQLVNFLETEEIDYLAVALIDEGITLRQNGCQIPIMVFNVQHDQIDKLWTNKLEPEVYSFELLEKLIKKSKTLNQTLKIHLKIDTGMNRLGFQTNDLSKLVQLLKQAHKLEVASIFSHLASSSNPQKDSNTQRQFVKFDRAYDILSEYLTENPLKHILNTGGIIRFPSHQYDMVRLGLGLYGIDESNIMANQLMKAHSLLAQVLQIKSLEADSEVGYEGAGSLKVKGDIAIINVGYADGLMRKAGNGEYKVVIKDKFYPIIGNICMDVSIISLGSNHNIRPGDEVIIFDPKHPIEALAQACQTIPYEILSRIAPRVKRSYIYQ